MSGDERMDALAKAIDDVTYEARDSFVGSRIMADRLAGVLYDHDLVVVRVRDISAAIVGLEAEHGVLAARFRAVLDARGRGT